MNQSKHTPGPWNVDGDATVYGPRFSIANDKEQIGIFEVADCKGYKQEREANAYLIASAPDLLAALNRLIQSLPEDSNEYPDSASARQVFDSIRFARETISKATGGTL